MSRSRGGGGPVGLGGRGAGVQSNDDVGNRRGAPRPRLPISGQNANSAEMERQGVDFDTAFVGFSQSSAAASSSETAAVQLRTPEASPRARPSTATTLSYDSSPGTEVSQLKSSQRNSPGNSSLGMNSPTVAIGLGAGAAYEADEGEADEGHSVRSEEPERTEDHDDESIAESAGAAVAGARSNNLTGRVSPHVIVSAFGFSDLNQFKQIRKLATIVTFNEMGPSRFFDSEGCRQWQKSQVIHYFVQAMNIYGCSQAMCLSIARFVDEDTPVESWQGRGGIRIPNLRNCLYIALKDYYYSALVEARHNTLNYLSNMLTKGCGQLLKEFLPEDTLERLTNTAQQVWSLQLPKGRTRAEVGPPLVKCDRDRLKPGPGDAKALYYDLLKRADIKERSAASLQRFLSGECHGGPILFSRHSSCFFIRLSMFIILI